MPSLSTVIAGIVFGVDSTAFLDAKLETLWEQRKSPGIAILVSREGQWIYSKCFGVENVASKKPMTLDSIHELASVGKQFTAAAVLLLAQDGKLRLDDPVSRYFPSESANWAGMTVKHLMQHTSGVPDYLAVLGIEKEFTIDQMVAAIREKPLLSPSGEKWVYSNTGYMVLGGIVEKVSKSTLTSFIEKRIFKRLGMKNSLGNDPTSKRIAMGYSKREGTIVEQGKTSKAASTAGYMGVMCSAADLAKWDAALWTDKILNAESRRAMFQPCNLPMNPGAENLSYYGMGWCLGWRKGKLISNHAGGWLGTSTFIERDMESKTCFIVLANADFEDTWRYRAPLAEQFLR